MKCLAFLVMLAMIACGRVGFDELTSGGAGAVDAASTAPFCVGEGTYKICLPATPDITRGVSGVDVDTDSSPDCLATQPAAWLAAGQPPACFFATKNMTIDALFVTGSRPLVIIAADRIEVTGLLDVASHRGQSAGPGSPASSCPGFAQAPGNNPSGGGGGAGGTFSSAGGNGGAGDAGAAQAGVNATAPSAPSTLRAGCDGQAGGGTQPGLPGGGGGGLYLVASNKIVLASTAIIDASGAGGSPGALRNGGSGGGSGGMIKLFAPTIVATGAVLLANGGGGASGSDNNMVGMAGADPSRMTPMTPAAGGTGVGGSGGSGFAGSAQAGTGGSGTGNQGGGGGGGGGGYIASNVPLAGAIVSAGVIAQ